MHMKSEWASFGCLVAAGTAVAGLRDRVQRPRHDVWGRDREPQIVEGAVQLPSDLVEHLLARDQIVCGNRRREPTRTRPRLV